MSNRTAAIWLVVIVIALVLFFSFVWSPDLPGRIPR